MAFTLTTPVTSIADTEPASYFDTITITGGALQMTHTDQFQGTNFGYNAQGNTRSGAPELNNYKIIERFPFATDTNATTVGSTSENSAYRGSGWSAPSCGFHSPGYIGFIEKVPFATNSPVMGQWAGIWRLTTNTQHYATPNSSLSHGYLSGGRNPGNSGTVTDMQRYPFACDYSAISTGALNYNREFGASAQNTTNGFIMGGGIDNTASRVTTVTSFPFAASTPTSNVGNLANTVSISTGNSSTTHGYSSGGNAPPGPSVSTITKFPFSASPATGTTVGNLSDTAWGNQIGISSTLYGYHMLGIGKTNPNPPTTSPFSQWSTQYEKYSFSTDGNATSVGNLTMGKYGFASWQD